MTLSGLVIPYGVGDLGQYWLRGRTEAVGPFFKVTATAPRSSEFSDYCVCLCCILSIISLNMSNVYTHFRFSMCDVLELSAAHKYTNCSGKIRLPTPPASPNATRGISVLARNSGILAISSTGIPTAVSEGSNSLERFSRSIRSGSVTGNKYLKIRNRISKHKKTVNQFQEVDDNVTNMKTQLITRLADLIFKHFSDRSGPNRKFWSKLVHKFPFVPFLKKFLSFDTNDPSRSHSAASCVAGNFGWTSWSSCTRKIQVEQMHTGATAGCSCQLGHQLQLCVQFE